MSLSTRIFLVLLRLAIGWHFLFEGVEKLNSDNWTSEAYLREASGPLAPVFKDMAGDTVVERLTPLPVPAGRDPARTPAHQRMPPALDREWNDYFERFVAYYQLDTKPHFDAESMALLAGTPDAGFPGNLPWAALYARSQKPVPFSNQRELAEAKLRQSKDETVRWLQLGEKSVRRESPYGPAVEMPRKTPERLEEYQKKLKEIEELQAKQVSQFGPGVNAKLGALKAEANRLRSELRNDLNAQTADMKKALFSVLTPEQKVLAPEVKSTPYLPATPDKLAVAPLPAVGRLAWFSKTQQQWIDWITKWGLTAVGICLIAGFLTRTACVAGAGFLLLFYLAMPALPWLPEGPRTEGHYFLVNKNIIEMLALLALATTRSGRWLGFDAWLQFLSPGRWRAQPEPRRSPSAPESVLTVLPADETSPVVAVVHHGSAPEPASLPSTQRD